MPRHLIRTLPPGLTLVPLLGLVLFLGSCSSGGESGRVSREIEPSVQAAQGAVQQLLELYSAAVRQEDIDRLQELLQMPDATAQTRLGPSSSLPQVEDGTFTDTGTFREAITTAFRTHSFLDLQVLESDIQVEAQPPRVTFREVESLLDPTTLEQRTRAFRTTFELRRDDANGIVTFRIAAVARQGPQFEIVTPGQLLAGAPARISATAATRAFPLVGVTVDLPETGETQQLVAVNGSFVGVVTPPEEPNPQPLWVRFRGATGEAVLIRHRYRLRMRGDGVVQRIAGTGLAQLFAVAIAPDGTVWAGGREPPFGGGTVYQALPGATTANFVRDLLQDLDGQVSDLVFDDLGRLHAIVLSSQTSGDVVIDVDRTQPPCQTVNVTGPAYPFRVRDLDTGETRPSSSTRAVAAGRGDIWLFGSDGGVARVADTFREGSCPQAEVQYDPVLRREDSDLLSNTVPALVVGGDGALWLGTALGLTRLQNGQFTPVRFDPDLSVQGDPGTLEAFFQQVAEAIFEARPLTTVELGGVSFVEMFGSPLVKEDLIFSAVEDSRGRLWIGTLGGGIRRIETAREGVGDTLHLTREQAVRSDPDDGTRTEVTSHGLISNLVFALAEGPDGAIWAATEEGVSRVREAGGKFAITNFSALDGLALPVRDVAVDGAGTVWLATDRGLFRIVPQGGVVQGEVRDPAGDPVIGADVFVLGTPFRAVTDGSGRFVLANLPPGPQRLRIDGVLASGGPFASTERDVEVTEGEQTLEAVVVDRSAGLRLVPVAGNGQTGVVGVALPQPMVVAVLDEENNPVSGVPVTFAVTRGNGILSASQPVLTDTQGRATATLMLGPQAGVQEVTATIPPLLEANGALLTFVATAFPDRSSARLARVAGNNQSVRPGESLVQPLVVRLQDQFGNPLPGLTVIAAILRGEGVVTAALLPEEQPLGTGAATAGMTNAQGEARFALQVGTTEQDIVVQVAAPALPQAEPVQFLTIVGTVDITDLPLDLAVAGEVVFVTAGFAGLQVVDVSDPMTPRIVQTVALDGVAFNVALANGFAYVTTFTPTAFVVLDISDPRDAAVVQTIELDVASNPVKIVLQGTFAYITLENRQTGTGSLQILDIGDPAMPTMVSSLALASQPAGLVVVDGFAYIPADTDGLLVIDIRDPVQPMLFLDSSLPTLVMAAGIASAGNAAYVVEHQAERLQLRVLDLSSPGFPTPRGATQLRSAALPFTASTIAVADGFAYVASFDLGLQVFDIKNPDAPRLVGAVPTPSVAFNVATELGASRTLIYITDLAVGLSIVAGPPTDATDTDGDGVIDFFDAFPGDADETLDTDRDGIGNNADPDDDNDGFPDNVEAQHDTDALNPKDFPVQFPALAADSTIIVDAAADQQGNGSMAAPYRSLSAAVQAVTLLRADGFASPLTVAVRSGIYSALHTLEAFPLILRDTGVTLQGEGADTTLIDAAFFADVLDIVVGGITIERLTLQNGVNGSVANVPSFAEALTFRDNHVVGHLFLGLSIGGGVGALLTGNQVAGNGFRGVELFNGSRVTLSGNTITDNGEDGVLLFNATADFNNNTIAANDQDGLQLTQRSSAAVVNNQIRDNAFAGILVSDHATASSIRGNAIATNGLSGVILQSGSMATVTDNDLTDNGRAVGQAGILVSGAGTSGTLTGNRLTGNGFGVVVQRASADVLSNTVRASVSDGVVVLNDAITNLIGNTIADNGGNGVTVTGGATATIHAGSITANTADGIQILARGSAFIATADTPLNITFNGDDGIDVEDDSGTVEINLSNIVFTGNSDQDVEGSP